jgi:formylglycine-generating enzyme required for sulfatase activity
MGENPSYFTSDLTRPVEKVSWFDAALYCNARSKANGYDTVYTYTHRFGGSSCPDLENLGRDLTKNGYRLPTEAEWEYACRAGTTTGYFVGDDSTSVGSYGWYNLNSDSTTHPVATKLPNAWGLYDMAGNVWQWCNDWYKDYADSAVTDPTGPSTGSDCVMRGGSWRYCILNLRSASRNYFSPGGWGLVLGFRCVRR